MLPRVQARPAAEEPLAVARPHRLAEDLGVPGLQSAHLHPSQTHDLLIHVHTNALSTFDLVRPPAFTAGDLGGKRTH